MLRVEVYDPDIGGYFPATIRKWNDETATVVYDNNWRQEQTVPLAHVRTTPPHEDLKPERGLKVDVLYYVDATIPPCWARANIVEIRGEGPTMLLLISYAGFDESFNEWVEPGRVRVANDNTAFDPKTLTRHDVPLSPDLAQAADDDGIKEELRALCGLVAVQVEAQPNTQPSWVLVGNRESIAKAQLVMNDFIRRLRIHVDKQRFLEQVAQRQQEAMSMLTHSFHIPREFVHLAIGPKGSYVSHVESHPEVDRVLIDRAQGGDQATVTVRAKTQEGLDYAKSAMNIVSRLFPLKEEDVGMFIGRNGATIQRLIDQSGVLRVNIVEGEGAQMIGSLDSVDRAFVLAESAIKLAHDRQQSIQEIETRVRDLSFDARQIGEELPSFMPRGRGFGRGRGYGRGRGVGYPGPGGPRPMGRGRGRGRGRGQGAEGPQGRPVDSYAPGPQQQQQPAAGPKKHITLSASEDQVQDISPQEEQQQKQRAEGGRRGRKGQKQQQQQAEAQGEQKQQQEQDTEGGAGASASAGSKKKSRKARRNKSRNKSAMAEDAEAEQGQPGPRRQIVMSSAGVVETVAPPDPATVEEDGETLPGQKPKKGRRKGRKGGKAAGEGDENGVQSEAKGKPARDRRKRRDRKPRSGRKPRIFVENPSRGEDTSVMVHVPSDFVDSASAQGNSADKPSTSASGVQVTSAASGQDTTVAVKTPSPSSAVKVEDKEEPDVKEEAQVKEEPDVTEEAQVKEEPDVKEEAQVKEEPDA